MPSADRAIPAGPSTPATATLAVRLGAAIAATVMLLLPAIWNRFPLLEWDTGGYLARWFEGYLVPARSTTYGLLLAAAAPLEFWPVVILQAVATVWVIAVLLRTHRINVFPFGLLVTIAVLSAITALPWSASILLTDIFAGLAVLAFHTVVVHNDRVSRRESVALVLFVAFAASTHSATYAVLLALGILAVVVSVLDARLVPRPGVARAVVALVLGAAMLLAGNYVVAKKLAWTPGGYEIAFGRMLQDGIVTRYLDDHCPNPKLKLCPYRHELPRDADVFLWGNSVFDRLGRSAGLGDELRTIVLGSLRDYPLMQLRAALVATAKQLVYVGTGEGIVTTMWHTYGIIEHFAPGSVAPMRAARQQHGELHFRAINAVHEPVAWASMVLLPLIVVLGLQSEAFADLARLAATIAFALLANAAVCGVISNPHDRYGSRMVWMAVFVTALAASRVASLARKRIVASHSAVPAAGS
jgi:hypothetical protein